MPKKPTYKELEQQIKKLKQEVTKYKRSMKFLQESEERFRIFFDQMSSGFGVNDVNGMITYANQNFCEMTGYKIDEIIGKQVDDLLDSESRLKLKDQTEKRMNGESRSYEIDYIRKDGIKVPTIISPKAIFNAKGKFEGSFAVITDITKQKKKENSLKRAVEELEKKLK